MSRVNNPTGTTKIENAWLREIGRRYRTFLDDVKAKLRENTSEITTNATIGMNAEQQRTFMAWLLGRIEELTGEPTPNNWQSEYQLQSYIRALEGTRASLISQGADLTLTDAEIMRAQGLEFTAIATLGSQIVAPAIHQDALEFLFTRSYESLKGWNDRLAKEVRQITFDAVKNGTGITDITRQIKERTGVARSRAETIARTEVQQAYKESALNETQRAAEELEEELKVRWISALKPNTRHRHSRWHGEIISIEEARKRKSGAYLSSDRYNCQCSIIPIIPGVNDTEQKNEKFTIQRAEYIKAEEAA